jgi:hypothetical protein
MSSRAVAGGARRLVAAATALMPPDRRDWGKAISAELDHASSPAAQARLVLGAARVALLPPPGLAGALGEYGRAVAVSFGFAVTGYLPLGFGLYLSDVVNRSGQDSAPGVLLMDTYLLLAMLTAGALARRMSARTGAHVIAGLVAGVVFAALGMATYAVFDHEFFSVISQQPDKIAGFQQSGMTSMHAYLNGVWDATAPGVIVIGAVAGVFLAPIGAALHDAIRKQFNRGDQAYPR